MSKKSTILFPAIRAFVAAVITVGAGFGQASALPASHYAKSSVLASGKWARVRVDNTGMQFLSNAQLKNLGFSDPAKVNVYGYGGREISLQLDAKQPDDLPMQPVIRTAEGIIFFGVNHELWTRTGNKPGKMTYFHSLHPYEDASYYFVSDREAEAADITPAGNPAPTGKTITSFTERIAHENDLMHAGITGRYMVGEDFRTTTNRIFEFALPDNVFDTVMVTITAAANISGSTVKFTPTFNGKEDKKISPFEVNPCKDKTDTRTATSHFYKVAESGNRLEVALKCNIPSTAVVNWVNLDKIEVEYERSLRMTGGELYFYLNSAGSASTVRLDGCSQATRIWDVTDPAYPKEVNFNLEGSTAVFGQQGDKYVEYLAFNPSDVKRQPAGAGRVTNQDIHSLPVPDMLIIAPQQFMAQAERVADMHRRVDGMTVHVITPDDLYIEFSSGTRDISAFRKALKMWHDRGKEEDRQPRYCLIMSRPTYDNKLLSASIKNGYPRIPIWQSFQNTNYFYVNSSVTESVKSSSYSTDDIIGMLEDCTNFDEKSAKVNVAVGRMPVKNLTEATQAVDKLIKYVEEPRLGEWRNNILLIADDQDGGLHMNQTEDALAGMSKGENGSNYAYDRIYFDTYPLVNTSTGPTYPQATKKLEEKMSEGVMFISYVGHGNPRELAHEKFLNWETINSLSNPLLPFFYTATCEFAPWDDDDLTAGEIVWLNPDAGFIGLISTNRSVFTGQNGVFTNALCKNMWERRPDGKRKTVGDIFIQGKNGATDSNKLRYILIGDPALTLPGSDRYVEFDRIAGVDVATADAEPPVLPARGKALVEGHVNTVEGALDTDFNGTIELTLFDAEKVVTTLGNGMDGKSISYNDQTSKIFRGNAKVVNGEWKLEVLLPAEIINNWTPGLMTAYVYSDKGASGNGHSRDFYVYGFDEEAAADNEGPEITRFTINNDGFRDGGAAGTSPLILASFTDKSGINISSSSLGHSMTLTLDDKTVYSDVANFYTPAENDPYSGSISYLLENIEPGEHTLRLVVWDNSLNSSEASLRFSVGAHDSPVIYNLGTDCNPARTSVVFSLTAEGPVPGTECRIDVYDLNGRRLWTHTTPVNSSTDSNIRVNWDLRDSSGRRVPRGIYLYRATISTPDGVVDAATKKLAVAAQ